MNFVKIRTYPEGEFQILNLEQIKRIKKEERPGEVIYELVLSGSDIRISAADAEEIFERIGVTL